ncbi:hypothetical protein ACQP3J_33910, partial [Escherichia coli]
MKAPNKLTAFSNPEPHLGVALPEVPFPVGFHFSVKKKKLARFSSREGLVSEFLSLWPLGGKNM